VKEGSRKNLKRVVLLTLVVVIVVSVIVVAAVFKDFAGSSANDSQTLAPSGTPVGRAMVVYNPGLSGQAKDAAMAMGEQLRVQGYEVTVAGVSSEAAVNLTNCEVVIVGGPMYGGKCSSSIESYLRSFEPKNEMRLGVFTTTGNANFDQSSLDSLEDHVNSLVGSDPYIVKTDVRLILTVGVDEDCTEMVLDLTTTN
jgi:hypothetical protein